MLAPAVSRSKRVGAGRGAASSAMLLSRAVGRFPRARGVSAFFQGLRVAAGDGMGRAGHETTIARRERADAAEGPPHSRTNPRHLQVETQAARTHLLSRMWRRVPRRTVAVDSPAR